MCCCWLNSALFPVSSHASVHNVCTQVNTLSHTLFSIFLSYFFIFFWLIFFFFLVGTFKRKKKCKKKKSNYFAHTRTHSPRSQLKSHVTYVNKQNLANSSPSFLRPRENDAAWATVRHETRFSTEPLSWKSTEPQLQLLGSSGRQRSPADDEERESWAGAGAGAGAPPIHRFTDSPSRKPKTHLPISWGPEPPILGMCINRAHAHGANGPTQVHGNYN